MTLTARYDFVLLFDVKDGAPTATRTPATCHGSTPRPATVW